MTPRSYSKPIHFYRCIGLIQGLLKALNQSKAKSTAPVTKLGGAFAVVLASLFSSVFLNSAQAATQLQL